ncbi:hypothetical protein CA265_17315 [Sphingobacteriaceae bacterium GW460-11-11-14-LB5]|nr:hypothetical protein CA265_17315 [Sphingobacteriaceae bacterium GW460-11-11-14-LB5]
MQANFPINPLGSNTIYWVYFRVSQKSGDGGPKFGFLKVKPFVMTNGRAGWRGIRFFVSLPNAIVMLNLFEHLLKTVFIKALSFQGTSRAFAWARALRLALDV